ncbi:hypothetical protein B0H11DRAFT_1943101 [Mycena galericulata]|nr:hypothetical protein B0H11DRAFT_1943101 [Mycena galericulata]
MRGKKRGRLHSGSVRLSDPMEGRDIAVGAMGASTTSKHFPGERAGGRGNEPRDAKVSGDSDFARTVSKERSVCLVEGSSDGALTDTLNVDVGSPGPPADASRETNQAGRQRGREDDVLEARHSAVARNPSRTGTGAMKGEIGGRTVMRGCGIARKSVSNEHGGHEERDVWPNTYARAISQRQKNMLRYREKTCLGRAQGATKGGAITQRQKICCGIARKPVSDEHRVPRRAEWVAERGRAGDIPKAKCTAALPENPSRTNTRCREGQSGWPNTDAQAISQRQNALRHCQKTRLGGAQGNAKGEVGGRTRTRGRCPEGETLQHCEKSRLGRTRAATKAKKVAHRLSRRHVQPRCEVNPRWAGERRKGYVEGRKYRGPAERMGRETESIPAPNMGAQGSVTAKAEPGTCELASWIDGEPAQEEASLLGYGETLSVTGKRYWAGQGRDKGGDWMTAVEGWTNNEHGICMRKSRATYLSKSGSPMQHLKKSPIFSTSEQ